MVRVVWVALLLLPGVAFGGPPKDLIPAGLTWSCTRVEGIPVCFRDDGECRSKTELDDCQQQAKASVVTYFDVMADRWAMVAFAATQTCNTFRKVMAKNPDVKSMSGCQLIGERLPPAAKLASAAIPGGTSWSCAPSRTCFRDDASCAAFLEGDKKSCVKQARVSLYTGTNPLEGVPTAFAFADAKTCNAERRLFVFVYDDVSACTTIGATAAPPAPKGWFCYEGTKDLGHCLRTKDDCDARRAFDVRADLAPGECAARDSAFAFVNRGDLEGYPTSKNCETALASEKLQVRCKTVK